MFYINYWYCLIGLGFLIAVVVLINFINFILIELFLYFYKRNKDCIKIFNKLINLENLCNNTQKVSENIIGYLEKFSIAIIFLPIIIILGNNLTIHIRENIKNTAIRMETNKQYFTNSNIKYHYYMINSEKADYGRDSKYIYYIHSTQTIEQLLKEQYILVDKNCYVRPYAITEITLEEFIQNYDKIIEVK